MTRNHKESREPVLLHRLWTRVIVSVSHSMVCNYVHNHLVVIPEPCKVLLDVIPEIFVKSCGMLPGGFVSRCVVVEGKLIPATVVLRKGESVVHQVVMRHMRTHAPLG